jgi:hypothetical protein
VQQQKTKAEMNSTEITLATFSRHLARKLNDTSLNKTDNMKRLFFCAGFALMLLGFNSCAQHDPKGPDTSGGAPVSQPGAGIDTTAAGTNNNGGNTGTNSSNDGTNNNGSVNTGDSGTSQH